MSEKELIDKIESDLGQAKALFNGQYTILVKTAVKHGYGVVLGEHLKKAYMTKSGISDGRIVEGILTTAMYHCENNYCYVIHSSWLLDLDIQVKHIETMMESLHFPEYMVDHERWSRVLRLVYFTFKDKNMSVNNLRMIQSMLSPEEYEHFTSIISLATFLEFLLTSFQSEIKVDKEYLFRDEDTGGLKKNISQFVKFYTSRKLEDAKSEIPVFVICSYCKDIKDNDNHWHRIESVLPKLPTDATFSHSVCESCFEKVVRSTSATDLSA